MKSRLLLHSKYKLYGFLLFALSLTLGFFVRFKELEWRFLDLTVGSAGSTKLDERINLTDEVALSGLIISLLFIAFAREKNEDEFINRTRLESWQWAVVSNYLLLFAATWAVHGFAFIDVMMYNMLTIPVIFILRFHYVLFKSKTYNETETL